MFVCSITHYLEISPYWFAGDPLYGTGGQPKYTDHEIVNESFAEDGYKISPEFLSFLFAIIVYLFLLLLLRVASCTTCIGHAISKM